MTTSNKTINRRDFLKTFGATGLLSVFDPFSIIESLLQEKQSGQALAQSENQSRYIAITSAGAPPRWVFDLLLNPRNSSEFRSNPHMGTRYKETNGVYTDVEYVLQQIGGKYWLPPLWNFNLPGPDGINDRKLSSLLPNLVHFRGIDTNNADHTFSAKLHFLTANSNKSLSAMIGDNAPTPLASINILAFGYSYVSSSTRKALNLPISGNGIAMTLGAFSSPGDLTQATKNLLTSVKSEIASAQDAIDSDIALNQPEYREILDARNASRRLMERRFPDFTTEWNSLLAKYEGLINRAITATYPGINDRSIGVPVGNRDNTYLLDTGKKCQHPDVRSIVQSSTSIAALAFGFALTEFVLEHDLSRSVAFNYGNMLNLTNLAESSSPGSAPEILSLGLDEHSTGKMISLLVNTLRYAAVGACLLELVAVCKRLNIWDNTVIDIAGEFNRCPRKDGTGSDHGFRGASAAVFSGKITNGPFVLGDVHAEGSIASGADYVGTWGTGAPVPELGGVTLTPIHFAASMATLLGTPSPVSAFPSLLQVKDGSIQPLPNYTEGKIIKNV